MKIKSDASWHNTAEYHNVAFHNYLSQTTYCGRKQKAIKLNKAASDDTARHLFYKTTLDNVAEDAFIYLQSPPSGWAKIDDCGEFPCTAPYNLVIDFEKTSYSGKEIAFAYRKFEIIPDTPNVSSTMSKCNKRTNWNAW